MGIEDLSRDDILQELKEILVRDTNPPPGAFTLYDWKEANGGTRHTARAEIGRLEDMGLVKKLERRYNGKVYYLRVTDDSTRD